MKNALKLSVLLPVLLIVGCQRATVVSDLQAALNAVKIALPIIEAAGLVSGPVGVAIGVAATAIDAAATELASNDPALTKAQLVNQDVQHALSSLPQSSQLPPNVAARVTAIQQALQAVLSDVQQQMPAARLLGPKAKLSLSKSDIEKLHEIAQEAGSLQVR